MARVGPMRHRVRVQARSSVQTATGEPELVWNPIGDDRWAAVEPISGQEFFASQQRGARLTTKFRMRYFADIKPRHRLLLLGGTSDPTVFDIVAVIPNGLKTEMDVIADELVEEAP